MTDQPDPLPVHEAEVRAYAADSADPILRRHLTAVLAEYDAMRPIVEAAVALAEHEKGRLTITNSEEFDAWGGRRNELFNALVIAVEEGQKL